MKIKARELGKTQQCMNEIKKMSEGLDAFNRIKSYFHPKQLLTKEMTLNDLDTIEKELKQAQEDKEMLNIFKNALTIEHDLSTPSFTPFEKDKPFDVNEIIIETIKIKQNELDEKLRKSLKEWVLKNAFPEELKRLKELEKALNEIIATIIRNNI